MRYLKTHCVRKKRHRRLARRYIIQFLIYPKCSQQILKRVKFVDTGKKNKQKAKVEGKQTMKMENGLKQQENSWKWHVVAIFSFFFFFFAGMSAERKSKKTKSWPNRKSKLHRGIYRLWSLKEDLTYIFTPI